MEKEKEIEYCTCGYSGAVYTETSDFGIWEICADCKKPIENTFEYLYECDEDY